MSPVTRYRLERGATGFYNPRAGVVLPTTDFKLFTAAWHSAARHAGGRVTEVSERQYPQNFHTGVLASADTEYVALCHLHLPLIAFVATRAPYYATEFAEPPGWSEVLTHSGFTVMPRSELLAPLSDVDTTGLSEMEWREVRFWKITTLGGVLFNSWD
jgi:hypothetical protein